MTTPRLFTNNDIDTGSLPDTGRAFFHPLELSYRSILIFSSVITWCLLILAAWIAIPQFNMDLFLTLRITVGAVILLLIFGLAHIILITMAFKLKGYAVREKDITYKTGLLMRRQTTIPYTRIQHVEVRQGILERYFNLGKLNIYTAGGQSSDLSIPGLKNKEAHRLKAFILGSMDGDEEE